MVSFVSLALLFLKLGTLAFGGPAAHIAMMRQEVVERRKWLRDAEFLDLVGAANLLPGPNSTEVALFIGHKLRGWRGLLLSGICFILPAALIVVVLAWLYQTYGLLPQVSGILRGVKPVVIAVVLEALRGLAQISLRSLSMGMVAAVGLVLAAVGMHPLLILIICGAIVVVTRLSQPPVRLAAGLLPWLSEATPERASLIGLLVVFLKLGVVVFGSGYVLLAFLQSDLVDQRHWLTSKQLLDAVAVGQVTPGPVFTTATFIGYLLAGVPGAGIATIGIFLPAFILVAFSGPILVRMRRSATASAFLDGVTVGSLALIAWVLVILGRTTLTNPMSAGIALASFVLLTRFRANAAVLVAAAGLMGAFTH